MNRILTVLILGFWLVMTALLVRTQVAPASTGLLAVPPEHLLRLMLRNGANSDLSILSRKERIGTLFLHPLADQPADQPALRITGHLALDLPAAGSRILRWNGTLLFDRRHAAEALDLTIELHQPPACLRILCRRGDQQLHYEITQEGAAPESGHLPLDRAALEETLRQAGLDPALLGTATTRLAPPVAVARQTQLRVGRETIAGYELRLQQGDTALAIIAFNQLGQVLYARSALGWGLVAQGVNPEHLVQ